LVKTSAQEDDSVDRKKKGASASQLRRGVKVEAGDENYTKAWVRKQERAAVCGCAHVERCRSSGGVA